jgi:hypothetical protein
LPDLQRDKYATRQAARLVESRQSKPQATLHEKAVKKQCTVKIDSVEKVASQKEQRLFEKTFTEGRISRSRT